MALNIQTGMFAVLRDGTVPEDTIKHGTSVYFPWFAQGYTWDAEGFYTSPDRPDDRDIVDTFATRAEALAYVADNPMNRELYPDGPDLASVPQTVRKTYTEAEAQAMVAAALRQAAAICMPDHPLPSVRPTMQDDPQGLFAYEVTEMAIQDANEILALIPQPVAPAPVVVDWQARAEAAEARGMERAAEIVSEAIKRWQDDEREEFHPDDPECPNYLEEAVTLIHSLVPAILAAAKESKA